MTRDASCLSKNPASAAAVAVAAVECGSGARRESARFKHVAIDDSLAVGAISGHTDAALLGLINVIWYCEAAAPRPRSLHCEESNGSKWVSGGEVEGGWQPNSNRWWAARCGA